MFIYVDYKVGDAKDVAQQLQALYKEKLHVDVDLKRIYSRSFMNMKKHYVGYGVDDKGKQVLDRVGMEGMKSNRPKFVKRVFEEITDKIFKSATIDKEEIIFIVRKMMDQISSKQIDAKELIRSEQLGKNPEDYAKPNDPMARKGRALGLRKGDNIEVYDADNEY